MASCIKSPDTCSARSGDFESCIACCAKRSTFFRDMVTGATPSAVPFETQISRKALERFLRYALHGRVEGEDTPFGPSNRGVEHLPVHLETYQLACKLDCEFVPQLRSRLVSSFGYYDTIPLFRSATRLGDIDLFRAVLGSLPEGDLQRLGIRNIVNAIRHDWQVAFLRCCISTTGHTYVEGPERAYPSYGSNLSLALKSFGNEMADDLSQSMREHV